MTALEHRPAPGGFAVHASGRSLLGVACDHEGGDVYHCAMCGPADCDRCRATRRVRRFAERTLRRELPWRFA